VLKKFLKKRWKEAANKLKFEEASKYRDRLKALDFLFSNQNVTLAGFDNFLDGFVFNLFDNVFSITILIVRNGKLIGTKTEHPSNRK